MDPVLTYTHTPALISGDSFSGALDRVSGEDVGFYDITQGDLALSSNYTLVVTSGVQFEIKKATTITTVTCPPGPFVYTGAAQMPCSAMVTGPGLNHAISVTYANNTNVGTASADATYPETGNYLTSSDSENFTIGQKTLTITTVDKTKTFGTTLVFDQTYPSDDFSVAGLVGSDTVSSITLTSAGAPAAAPIGSYPIVGGAPYGTGLGNYTVGYVNGTLTVSAPANYPPVASDKEVAIVVRSKPHHYYDDDEDEDDHRRFDYRKHDGHGHHDYFDRYGGRWDRDDDDRDDDDNDREWERFADSFRGLRITLTATDRDDRRLRFRIVDGPDHGILSRVRKVKCVSNGTGGGSCTAQVIYIPEPHYLGPDVFTYVANDRTQDGNVATVTINLVPPFTTYSQGAWGSRPWGGNPGRFLADNFASVYGAGGVTIGGAKSLKFTSASAINGFLPAGGKAAALPSNAPALAVNSTSSKAGVLAGHVLALQLNVDFSDSGETRPGLRNQKIDRGKLRNKNVTVGQLLAFANTVLGGTTSGLGNVLGTGVSLTVSELSDIIEKVNENYDNGKKDDGYLALP
jgi:hypothetical protein